MSKYVSLGTWAAGGDVKLDIPRLLLTRMLIQANSGNGKSYLLRRLFEVTAGLVQQLIIDPEGEFATLREKHDLVIISGSGGDALAHPKTAALLARRLLETEASAVLDISDLKANERHPFVRLFLESLIEAPKSLRHPVLVALDEMQIYCPEKGQGESEAGAAVIDVATRGRKRGLCLIGATQRISMLHKGVAAECKNRLIGGTSLDVDVKRAAFDLGLAPQEALKQLRALEPGHFYAFGPAFHQLEPLELLTGEVHTSHPKVGHRQGPPPEPTKAILAMLPKLADLPKEAEQQAKSMDDLRRELAQVRRELTQAKRAQPAAPVVSREDLKAAESKGFERGAGEARRQFEKEFKSLERLAAPIYENAERATSHAANLIGSIKQALVARPQVVAQVAIAVPTDVPRMPSGRTPDREPKTNGASHSNIHKMGRAILATLAQFPDDGCDIGKVALLTGYRKSGGFYNELTALRNAGFITGANTETMRITQDGLDQGPFPDRPTQGAELLQFWMQHGSFHAMERKIMQTLAGNPDGLGIDQLAELAGYQKSGGFYNSLTALRTAGVMLGRNTETMRLSPEIL